jgi:hypothetical protein
MKSLRLISALLLIGFALQGSAQVKKRTAGDSRKKDKKEEDKK